MNKELQQTNDALNRFNLPILKDVVMWKQIISHILNKGKYIILILMFLLLMPYNTELLNQNDTKIIYPDTEIALLANAILLLAFLASWGWGLYFYQMTYKDVIRAIERAEANRLFTSEVAEVLIAMVLKAKELKDEDKQKKKIRTLEYYQKFLEKKGFNIDIDILLKQNELLSKEVDKYKEFHDKIEAEVLNE